MDFVKQPVQADMNLGFLTLRGAVCQTIGTRSTCRLPLIMVQISCMEGRWHRNWFQSRCYFCGRPRKNQKMRCFVKRFVTFNLYKDILNPESLKISIVSFPKNLHVKFFSKKRQSKSSRTQVSEYLYNGFCGFTSVWTREWVFKHIFWLKCLFHWVHLYFLVP